MKTLFLSLFVAALITSCTNQPCPEKACDSDIRNESIKLLNFSFHGGDTIRVQKFEKGDTNTALSDTVYLSTFGPGAISINQNLGISLGMMDGFDWKITIYNHYTYFIINISSYRALCAECKYGNTYYEEFEYKVNGDIKRGQIVLEP
jgi:hypothetical protein